MTRTCHTLREGGARFLLDGRVLLTTGDGIISFLQFLDADAVNRLRYLRVLELACGEIPPRAADALLDAESMFKSTPTPSSRTAAYALVTSFAQLTTLRHVTIDLCGQRACSFISTIRSPLRTVFLGFPPLPIWRVLCDAEPPNPILLLANTSETLEEISGSNFTNNLDHVMFDVVYPSVRRISVTYDNLWSSLAVACPLAFPNLFHLSLTSVRGCPVGNFDTPTTEMVQLALLFRSEHREDQESRGRRWTHLEEVVGHVIDVLMLGVTVVLEDTRPTSLAIAVVGAAMFEDDSMAAVLKDPSARRLQTLEMELCFRKEEGEVNVWATLNNVARTLALVRLRHLALTLNYGLLTGTTSRGNPRYPAHKDFDSLDLEASAELFRTAISSLVDTTVRLSTDRTWHDIRLGFVEDNESMWSSGSWSSDFAFEVEMDDDVLPGNSSLMAEEDEDSW
ncbi:hypothetical protein LXA43DRAFT_1099026 [Ganoderma leucocontextum]|nr:hypothetical protein LXA43DRAFT_1099026 [Ganoderma leucocontextum]